MSRMNFYPVFVNHIADSVQPSDLRAVFDRLGAVTDVVIVNRHGFVNMAREEEAREAIHQLKTSVPRLQQSQRGDEPQLQVRNSCQCCLPESG